MRHYLAKMLPGPIFTVSTRVSRYRAPPRPRFTSPRACSVRAEREVLKNSFRGLAAAIQVIMVNGAHSRPCDV